MSNVSRTKIFSALVLVLGLHVGTAHAMGKQKSSSPTPTAPDWLVPSSTIASLPTTPICGRSHDSVQRMIETNYDARMGFQNGGGMKIPFSGGDTAGTCWWHSRFERSASYLAVFRPDLAKPSLDQVKSIIASIINLQPVTVPGYDGLTDFSWENRDLIQTALDAWQKSEALRGLNTLALSHQMRGKKLWKRMNYIFNEFAKSHAMLFLEINAKGFGGHSLLVHNMIRNGDRYSLRVSDSNFPGMVLQIDYAKGDRSLRLIVSGRDVYGAFIPYLDQGGELNRINAQYASLCGHGVPTAASSAVTVPASDTDGGEGDLERQRSPIYGTHTRDALFAPQTVSSMPAPNAVNSTDGLLPYPTSDEIPFEQAYTRPRADEYDPYQVVRPRAISPTDPIHRLPLSRAPAME